MPTPATSIPDSGTVGASADRRIVCRSRLAGAALVAVLLSVSVFAVWSSQAVSNAAERTVTASGLSDDYAHAAVAVGEEESLERKYRLEPGPGVRASYQRAAAQIVAALGEVRRDGDQQDRALVDGVLAQHSSYLQAIERLFVATDQGDTAAALRIDGEEVDPPFDDIRATILLAATQKHDIALAELANLQRLESLTGRLTPLVFVTGLGLAALLAAISRGHRRQLDVERACAVRDSLHDALTGLPNRSLLADRVGQALRADGRKATTTGLLLIDIDRFKDINDTFGHHYGDQLLRQVGPRLAGKLHRADTVARLGGDEFAVLLPDVSSLADAVAVAEQLHAALEISFQVEEVELDVEASVGVVVSGQHGTDAATLLQRADIAMYVAKTHHLGVATYDPSADGHSPSRLALLGELRRALDRDELVLHYQPQVSISTGYLVGAEALVRWHHPRQGLVYPDTFIPLAELTGIIGPLTLQVLNIALGQARAWAAAEQPLPVSVNLSARNLLDERLPGQVAELLAIHDVPARLLELEITESAIMSDPARSLRLLHHLADLGVRLSIDDFGAGYTSLGQLQNLPVTELKIDRSFIMSMQDPHNAVIVRSVINLGHNFGLTLVAEGEETQCTLSVLRDFGCDVAQGYYVSRPLTADAFTAWRTHHTPARYRAAGGAPASAVRPPPLPQH